MASDYLGRVRRSIHLDSEQGWIFGVCAGLARYFKTDAAIVRVAFVVTGLFFPKIVAASYLVLWLILDDRLKK